MVKGNKLKCTYCGRELTEQSFFASSSKLNKGINNRMPICKACLSELYIELSEKYESEELALERICMMFDMYFSTKLLISSEKYDHGKPRLSKYISNLNMRQYKGKTYEDTFMESRKKKDVVATKEEISLAVDDINKKSSEAEIDEETIHRFGLGFEVNDYIFLQNEYNDWITRHECRSKSQEEMFVRLSFKKLDIIKAQLNGKETKDLDKTYQDLLATANLQPKQMKNSIVAEGKPWGVMIKDWEEEKPIFYKDKDFEDVDKISKYVDIWFKGGLASGMGLEGNFFSSLYHSVIDKFTVKRNDTLNDDVNKELYKEIFGSEYEDQTE